MLVALLIQPHPLPDGTTKKQLQISPNVPRAAGLEGRCGGLGERTQRQKSSPVENQGQNLAQKHPWKCLYKTSPGSCVIRRGGQRVRNDKWCHQKLWLIGSTNWRGGAGAGRVLMVRAAFEWCLLGIDTWATALSTCLWKHHSWYPKVRIMAVGYRLFNERKSLIASSRKLDWLKYQKFLAGGSLSFS